MSSVKSAEGGVGVGGCCNGGSDVVLVDDDSEDDPEDGGHDNSVRRKGPGSVGVYWLALERSDPRGLLSLLNGEIQQVEGVVESGGVCCVRGN